MEKSNLVNKALLGTSVAAVLGSAYLLYKTWKGNEEEEDCDDFVEIEENLRPLSFRQKKSSQNKAPQADEALDQSLLQDIELDQSEIGTQIYKICISAGVQGGKTTAMSKVSEQLTSLGYKVFVCPNVYTLTRDGGVEIFDKTLSKELQLANLITYLKMIMKNEDYFFGLAGDEVESKCVVLCNSGTMDAKAYVDEDLWEAMISETGWTEMNLRGSVHLTRQALRPGASLGNRGRRSS
jgi:hypothetical protein